MDDSTKEEDERIYADPIKDPRGWLGLTFLTWSVVLSCLLHGSFLVPSFMSGARIDSDLDIEWMKSFENLEGLGHGSSGRWADVDLASLEPKKPAEPIGPEPPPEPVGPEPPPEPPKPKPQPTSTTKPRPKPDAKPKPAEPKPKPKPEPKKPGTPREVYSQGELPGLDRTGPSGLPAMDGYGPGNAVFTALVRFDRIRGTEFEADTRELIEAVPDYRILLDGTGVDPVRDFSSMFMASANPIYIDETFLAVRHRTNSSDLRSNLDRRFDPAIAWDKQGNYHVRPLVPPGSAYNDVRQVLVPPNDLALVARPEWISQLTRRLPDGSRMLEGVDVDALNRRPTMLDGLLYIERAADESTVVLVSAMAIRLPIPGVGMRGFDGIKMRIANIDEPKVTIDAAFRTPDAAARFASQCPTMKESVVSEVPLVARFITKMLVERLQCSAAGNFVTIEGTYTRSEVHRVMNAVTPLIPRPPLISRLPKPKKAPEPPPKADFNSTSSSPDAGSSEEAQPQRDAGQQQDQGT